jgi:hypothetical protein
VSASHKRPPLGSRPQAVEPPLPRPHPIARGIEGDNRRSREGYAMIRLLISEDANSSNIKSSMMSRSYIASEYSVSVNGSMG